MKTLLQIYTEHVNPKSKKRYTDAEMLAGPSARRGRHGNVPVVIDNIWFQSTGEGYYYLELKERQNRMDIREFKRQVPVEFFVHGVRIGKYIADFMTMDYAGNIEVIDYKSRHTVTLALYQIKKALMLACYSVAIKEVGVKK